MGQSPPVVALSTTYKPLEESIRLRQNNAINRTSIKGMKQMRLKEFYEHRNERGSCAHSKSTRYNGKHSKFKDSEESPLGNILVNENLSLGTTDPSPTRQSFNKRSKRQVETNISLPQI